MCLLRVLEYPIFEVFGSVGSSRWNEGADPSVQKEVKTDATKETRCLGLQSIDIETRGRKGKIQTSQ